MGIAAAAATLFISNFSINRAVRRKLKLSTFLFSAYIAANIVVALRPELVGAGREAVDAPWHPFTAKLVRTARATVVPIYFPGQNSRFFQLASHLSYSLRIALLFRETANRLGSQVDVAIGPPIPFAELEGFTDRRAMTLELRRRTLELARFFRPRGAPLPDYRQEFHFPAWVQE